MLFMAVPMYIFYEMPHPAREDPEEVGMPPKRKRSGYKPPRIRETS